MAGGSTAGGSTAGGSTAGGSTAGGSTAGGSTAGGSTAGGSTAGGSEAVEVQRSGTGDGGVTSTPAGIDCGATCTAPFTTGSTVVLRAQPAPSSVFSGWSGDCAGSGDCSLSVNGPRTATARFDLALRTLQVISAGSGTGRVTTMPAGIDCGSTCSADFPHGTLVTLSATPAPGSRFDGWTGACSGTAACTLDLSQPHTVVASFTRLMWTLSVVTVGSGTGNVTSMPAGISCGASCTADFADGAMVSLTPAPLPGSTFDGWSGACSGTGACVLNMTAARTVAAQFTAMPLLTIVNVGGGSVTSAPAGISCGSTCSARFPVGSPVDLTATPAPGAVFLGWAGACSGTSTCSVALGADLSVTATFGWPVTASVSGAGTGTVTSTPTGVSCPGACTSNVAHGTPLTLTANPGLHSTFAGWTGASCAGTAPCSLTVTGPVSAGAAFDRASYALSVVLAGGAAGGSVTSIPAGISCGATCTASYLALSAVALNPVAASGATFRAWVGCDSVVGSTCNVTMNGPKTVTAVFTFPVAVSLTGGGGGTVTGTGINCPGDCSENVDNGATLTLTATANAALGATFDRWVGCSSVDAQNRCVVDVSSPRSVTATFRVPLTVNLTSASAPAGSGTITGVFTPPGGSAQSGCGAGCTVDYGTAVVLTAAPDGFSQFVSWSNCPSPFGSSCSAVMTSALTVSARFDRVYYDVSVSSGAPGSYPPVQPGGGVISGSSTPAATIEISGCTAGTSCSGQYVRSSTVQLTATPDSTSAFGSWANCPSATGNVCTLSNLSASRGITASFTRLYSTLTVATAGAGFGTVTSSAVGGTTAINCGYSDSSVAACTEAYVRNTSVVLTATPENADAVFSSWSSGCTSVAGNSCTVIADASKTVTATFVPNCVNTSVNACASAIALSTPAPTLNVSGTMYSNVGSSVWYQVNFPCGVGTPRLQLTTNPGNVFRLELFPSCGSAAFSGACWPGGGTNATDTAYACGPSCSASWPTTMFFRVYRTGSTRTCTPYTVTVSR